MKPSDEQMLRDAIERNAGAVVSLPSAGMLRHHKTRMIAAEADGFWVEAPRGEAALVAAVIASGEAVGLAMKSGAMRIVMATTAARFQPAMQINRHTAVDALKLAWPTQVKAVQRRANYRVTVTADAPLSVRVWRVSEQHDLRDDPPAAAEVRANLRDLSVGGVSVRCGLEVDGPKLVSNQRLRIAFAHAGGRFLVEGRVRHVVPLPNGDVRLGVQFQNLESGLLGRQAIATLTQIVGELQRDEARRRRLGLARSA